MTFPPKGVYLHILKPELDSEIYPLDNLEKYLLLLVLQKPMLQIVRFF
jgi:hypothetical protein